MAGQWALYLCPPRKRSFSHLHSLLASLCPPTLSVMTFFQNEGAKYVYTCSINSLFIWKLPYIIECLTSWQIHWLTCPTEEVKVGSRGCEVPRTLGVLLSYWRGHRLLSSLPPGAPSTSSSSSAALKPATLQTAPCTNRLFTSATARPPRFFLLLALWPQVFLNPVFF